MDKAAPVCGSAESLLEYLGADSGQFVVVARLSGPIFATVILYYPLPLVCKRRGSDAIIVG